MNYLLCSPGHTLQNYQTALHVAAGWGNTEAVKMLLDNMADTYAVDKVYT